MAEKEKEVTSMTIRKDTIKRLKTARSIYNILNQNDEAKSLNAFIDKLLDEFEEKNDAFYRVFENQIEA